MCDDGFSDVGASAICNEMGYDSSVITWANSNLFDSVQQSYEIAMDDVECQTDNFAECTYITSNNCAHSEDLYLTCGTGSGKWRCGAAFHVHSSNMIIMAIVCSVNIYIKWRGRVYSTANRLLTKIYLPTT